MQTKSYRREDVKESWWLVNAEGKTLGRLASQVAGVLRGKHRPTYSPNADTGDFVVVINSEKINMSGGKWSDKKYYKHSGFFGSISEMKAEEKRAKDPNFIIEEAVKGMLPKNRLARTQIKHLKVYAGGEHPHQSQNPQALEL